LGYIFTDGTLVKLGPGRYGVVIASVDHDHLEKLAAIFGSGMRIEKRIQSSKGFSGAQDRYIYLLRCTRPEMIADLRRLGLIERKSLTMRFPDVPEEFLRDFVRGCWDGDGSLGGQNHGRALVATFTTGSLDFVTGMRERLTRYGFGRLTIHTQKPDGVKMKNPAYRMKIISRHAIAFCEFLYDHVPSSLFLMRKFLIYEYWRREAARANKIGNRP
jgi:hypothetical protein